MLSCLGGLGIQYSADHGRYAVQTNSRTVSDTPDGRAKGARRTVAISVLSAAPAPNSFSGVVLWNADGHG